MTETLRYHLYYSPDSANLIVRLILEEMGAPYASVLVDRGASEQRSAAYRRLNPQGLIPVLLDGERVLFETAAIALHLGDREQALVPLVGEPERPDLYKWLFYLSNTLHADLRIVFYTQRYAEDRGSIPMVRSAVQSRVLDHFRLMDNVLVDHGGPWLLPWGLSICDFYLAVCARWAALYPTGLALRPGWLHTFGRVRELLLALERRPAVAAACRREGIDAPFFSDPTPPVPGEGSVF